MSETVRVLTLTQPWASLLAVGAKLFETRGWQTKWRGPLAIHAASGPGKFKVETLRQMCHTEPFKSALQKAGLYYGGAGVWDMLPRGEIIAVCDLSGCWPTEDFNFAKFAGTPELSFGDFGPNRYAWVPLGVRQLSKPLPAVGKQGLWMHDWAPIAERLG